VAEKYAFWQATVRQSGPQGLRALKGFHDEALSGQWEGHRSSRLSLQWRVIYRTEATIVTVYVEKITAHDYRK
jgi:mRNA-degrading endonuclease YafQ of YafQ-DinJ toxin-antitoxin module